MKIKPLARRKMENRITESAMKMHKNDSPYKAADYIDFAITVIMVLVAVFAFRAFIFEPVQVDGESMNQTLQDGERMFVEKFSYWFENPSRGDIVICKYPKTYKNGEAENQTFVKRVIGLPGETIKIEEGIVYIKKAGGNFYQKIDEVGYVYCCGEFKNENGDDLKIYGDTVYIKKANEDTYKSLDKANITGTVEFIGESGETVKIENGIAYIKSRLEPEYVKIDEAKICDKIARYFGNINLMPTKISDDAVFVMGDNRTNSTDSRSVNEIKINRIIGRVHGVVFPFNAIRDLGDINYGE